MFATTNCFQTIKKSEKCLPSHSLPDGGLPTSIVLAKGGKHDPVRKHLPARVALAVPVAAVPDPADRRGVDREAAWWGALVPHRNERPTEGNRKQQL